MTQNRKPLAVRVKLYIVSFFEIELAHQISG